MMTSFFKDISQPLQYQKDVNLLTMLVYGEARGESITGKLAVAFVAINRWRDKQKRWGKTLPNVILKKRQFSCFNEDDPNFKKITKPDKKDIDVWRECWLAACDAYFDLEPDPTRGATHYVQRDCHPSWRRKLSQVMVIENHVFFKER